MKIFNYNKYDCYSFDVFDTLLYRTLDEKEIFNIVEEKLLKINKKYKNFATLRIKNQYELQKRKNVVETTIDEIYDCFNNYSDEEKQIALNMEIETEKENLIPNLVLKKMIDDLLEQGKKIIIISDMYFNDEIISDLLKYFGFKFDYIFVSSDYQCRKSNGKMYKLVLNKIKVNKKRMIHIGDNKVSDYLMCKIKGIDSFLWKKGNRNHTEVLKKLGNKNYDNLYNFINKKKGLNFYSEIGYKYFGPVLYGFCNWIMNEKKEKKLDQICFLSRDGQIVSKAFSIIYEVNYPYFLASRRTLTVPLLENISSNQDILDIIPYIKRNESISSFFKKVGIDNVELKNNMEKKYGSNIQREFLLSEKGKEFFSDIKDYIKENSKIEKKAARNYIEKNLKKGRIGLVDIGWYGTMQKSIDKICNMFDLNYSFYGLYFGLLDKRNSDNNLEADGFIYNYKENNNMYNPAYIYGFNGLIELIFTADHPSARKYVMNGNKCTCILEENVGEYSEFVKEVQKGALDFISDFKKSNINFILGKESFKPLEDLLLNPTLPECYLLGNLKFYDAYFEKIIQFDGWKKFLLNPKSNIKKFLNSNWKIGYIKEMFRFKNSKEIYLLLNKIK